MLSFKCLVLVPSGSRGMLHKNGQASHSPYTCNSCAHSTWIIHSSEVQRMIECSSRLLMTFIIFITLLIFHYLHLHDYYRLTSEKFWTRPVFFLWPHGNIFLLLWVWEAGQEQPSENRIAFDMRSWRKGLYMYLQNLTLSFFLPVWLPVALFALQQVTSGST